MYMPTLARFTALDPLPPVGQPVLLGTSRFSYAENNPVNRFDPSGLAPQNGKTPSQRPAPDPPKDVPSGVTGCKCGEAINCAFLAGPLDCSTANDLAKEALAMAAASGYPGAHNGKQDAYRHCYWSCRMTQEIGAETAKIIGDLHEACGANPVGETDMDLWNNAIGRQKGRLVSPPDRSTFCDGRCRSATQNYPYDAPQLQLSPGSPSGTGTQFVP